jgi:excisionase family DNA binding protein
MRPPVNPLHQSKDQHPEASRGRMSADKAARGTPRFFTIGQVAEFLNLSSRSVRRLIDDGQLPVHRFGRAVRIAEADLRAFIATHRDG